MPSVSVLIPTRNRVVYLRECLASVLAQSVSDLSVVVVDNASTEDVAGLVASFADPRVSIVRHQVDIGSINNMNAALDLAQTPFFVIFHDDDTMHPRMLEAQLRVFDRHPALAFVATDYRNVTHSEEMGIFPERIEESIDLFADERALVRFLMAPGTLNFGSIMYRKAAVDDHHLDFERFGRIADRPFLPLVATGRPSACLRGPWVNYRLHPGQQSNLGPLVMQHLSTFLRYYRSLLTPGWDRSTEWLFLRYASNVLLDTYGAIAATKRPPLRVVLTEGWRDGIFHPFALRRPGAVALARAAVADVTAKLNAR